MKEKAFQNGIKGSSQVTSKGKTYKAKGLRKEGKECYSIEIQSLDTNNSPMKICGGKLHVGGILINASKYTKELFEKKCEMKGSESGNQVDCFYRIGNRRKHCGTIP